MRTRIIAAVDFLLILPAALFMAALVLRELPSLQNGAQQFVMWYAGRGWTLWVLLLALPFTALVTGFATLVSDWRRGIAPPRTAREAFALIRGHFATAFVAATTLAAGAILAIVVLHMAAN